MTDISSFPSMHDILVAGDNVQSFNAGEAITAGQVVGIAATGVSGEVVVMDNTSGENAIGVALFTAAEDEKVAVAMLGCIVNVANADDTTAIDAGGYVEQNDNSVGGTVSEFSPRADLASTTIDATDDTTVDGSALIVGIALDDIAGGGTGRILVQPQLMLYSDHAVV